MTVIAGKAIDRLGLASWVEARPTGPGSAFPVTMHRTFGGQPMRLRTRQPSFIPVDVDHDPARIVGQVRYLEETNGGDVWAVADLHQLPATDAPLYFSADVHGPNADDIELRAVAITETPAMVSVTPLHILPGITLADLPENETLRMRRVHPHLAGLLERARDAERGRRHGDPPLFHRRGEAAHHHLAHRDGDAPPGSGWISYDGRPTAAPQRGSTGQVIGVH